MSERRTYTPEQRAEALTLYVDHGPAEASRRTGIPAKTIASWAGRSGTQTDAPSNTAAAVESAALSLAARKQRLASDLMDDIYMLRERLRAPHTERKVVTLSGGMHAAATYEVVAVEHPTPPTGDLKALVTSMAILVDKVEVLAPGAVAGTAAPADGEEGQPAGRDLSEVTARVLQLVESDQGRKAG